MLVTEEQAQDIECQDRTRNALLQAIAAGERPSTDGQSDWSVGCIASKCMWWRWVVGPPTALEEALYDETDDKTKHVGFCGLAGKP